ncbi:hypothetical protein Airi02_040380 [Actinoallomurus iriomotensis]|uniref:Tetratricopeptide repeat protein n=1 Tax=Actinoallomurus iriomotensis TaxID=478107 RepID=A0A9W6W086_9ACTN|nr:hypothetical protein Airi02_040380 [Actinoallomurus iriomotensis]
MIEGIHVTTGYGTPGEGTAGGDDELAAFIRDPDGAWIEARSDEELADLAERLGGYSDRLSATGSAAEALSASGTALRIYRALLGPGRPPRPFVLAGHARAVARQARLLTAADPTDEIQRLTEQTVAIRERVKESAHRQTTVARHRLDQMRARHDVVQRWSWLESTVRKAKEESGAGAPAIARRLAALPVPSDPPQADLSAANEFGQVTADAARSILLAYTGDDGEEHAGRAGDVLGRIAPALVLAGRYVAEVEDADLGTYVVRYEEAAPRLWNSGVPAGCPEPAARACLLSLEHLAARSESARELLELCACLAADADIPLDRLLAAAEPLPPALRAATDDDLAAAIGVATGLGLLSRTGAATVRVDPLVQAMVCGSLGDRGDALRETAGLLLLAAFPQTDPLRGVQPGDEPGAAALAPHMVALVAALGDTAPPLSAMLLDALAARHIARREFAEAERTAARALAIKERELPPDSDQAVSALDLIARIRWELGDVTGRRAALDRSLAIQEARLGGNASAIAHLLRGHADSLIELGDHQGARAALERARALLEDAPDIRPETYLKILDRLGGLLAELDDRTEAIAVHRRALAVRDRLFGPDDPELLDTLLPMAGLLREEGDLAGARTVLERALTVHEASFAPDRPREAIGRGLLDVTAALGERPAARAVAGRLLDLYTPHLGFDHPHFAGITTALVDSLVRQGDDDMAATALERIAAAKESGYGPKHPEVFASLARLAEVQRRRGDRAAVVAALERLAEAKEQRYGDHEAVAAVLLELGAAKASAGDLAAALPVLQRALTVTTRLRGRGHPKTAGFAVEIALVVHRAGDLERARTLLEMSVGLCESAHGPDHAETRRAREALADVLERLGDATAAGAPSPSPAQLHRGDPVADAPTREDPTERVERTGGGPPTSGRLTPEDLDGLEPGWVDPISSEDLRGFARRLQALAGELERTGQVEQALRATTEAVRAERLVVARMTDGDLQNPQSWLAFAKLTGHRIRLLRATGRVQEVVHAEAEMRTLHRRVSSWLPRLQEEHARRARRNSEILRERAKLITRLVEQRGLADRRIVSVTRRMTGTPTPETRSLPPRSPGRPAHDERIEAAFRTSRVVTATRDAALTYARTAPHSLIWWIDAGSRITLLNDLSRLAERIGVPPTLPEVAAELARRRDWLLVFADASSEDLARFTALSSGNVLIATTGDSAEAPDDALSRLTDPAGIELLRICAFLSPAADIPLDRLTAPIDLLPDALSAAAESDPGLTGPLTELTRLTLLAREGTAARITPAVAKAVKRGLTPDELRSRREQAAMLVLTGLTGSPDRAAPLAPHAAGLADETAASHPILAVMLLDQVAAHLVRHKEPTAAAALLRRAQRLRREIYPFKDPETTKAATRLVALLHEIGDHAAAAEEIDHHAKTPDGAVSEAAAEALHEMADRLRKNGDRSAAQSVVKCELAIREELAPDSAEVAGLLRVMATDYLWPAGRNDEAAAALERSVLITETLHGPDSLQVYYVLGDLARILTDAGDAHAAKPVLRRRLAIIEAIQGPGDMATELCRSQLEALDNPPGPPS